MDVSLEQADRAKKCAIVYEAEDRTFTIHTKTTTYQMQVDRYGFLLHLYYGKTAEGCMDFLLTYADRGFSGNPYDAGPRRTYSMDALPQEFPTLGTGDYRTPACILKNADGSYACDFRYESHRILPGKYGLKGLPAVYVEEPGTGSAAEAGKAEQYAKQSKSEATCPNGCAKSMDAQTLEITLIDRSTGVKAVLLYGVLLELDIITRSVKIINGGAGRIYVEKLAPACLDFVAGNYDFLTFYGRHAMERNLQRMPISHGISKIGSFRGTSSHQENPAVIVAEHGTTEDAGQCYALAFVYSGGFQSEAQKDQYDQTRVLMGLSEEMFSYPLAEGEEFTAPEVILSYSSQGLAGLSWNLHRCIRGHVCRGKYRDQRRPILINSWEAAYFDFTGETLLELAAEAADLGVEMLVLDDGWFGKRDQDDRSLGDWQVNEKKLGCTFGDLTSKIHAMGLKFGLWIEPEMVNEDSDLYRAHPDWALAIPGRPPVRGRSQLVLDFSRQEVVDYIFEQICSVLDQGTVEYIKWDMNRSLSDIFSARTDCQGKVLYDYVLGVYDFLERLLTRYPDILIEGCSGGGGRFDAGMLYYTPQIWCSDNSDAVDRLRIQYGTSFIYPVSAVGSHVSASPNHQTGRSTPLKTRGITAMAGTFGYELDLNRLSEEEKEEIRSQIRDYLAHADLIQNGRYYRLTNPAEDAVGAWMFVSEDGSEALLCAVALEQHGNLLTPYVRLKGLKENMLYREVESGKLYNSTALMEAGIPLVRDYCEYQAYEVYFMACE
ncbi:MAG: alpha-galactosidase [Lachnospiraceae bacterium]|nr:alpha-galactosidase [Lachnospiraceae bacterium]